LNNNSYEDGVLLLEDEFIIAVSGSFVIRAKSFNTEEKATLCSPDEGVLLPKGVTRYISDVGTESIALIINVKSSDL
jgi:hypothetical protein